MLKATLNKEVAKPVDHKRVSLSNDRLHDFELLLSCADFELLLEENGSLLVVISDNLVDDQLPVAAHVTVQKATVIDGFVRRNISGH